MRVGGPKKLPAPRRDSSRRNCTRTDAASDITPCVIAAQTGWQRLRHLAAAIVHHLFCTNSLGRCRMRATALVIGRGFGTIGRFNVFTVRTMVVISEGHCRAAPLMLSGLDSISSSGELPISLCWRARRG